MYEPLFPGPPGDWLAGIGIVSCFYRAFRLPAALRRYARKAPAAAAPGLAEDLPVIAAAVAAMLDSHRIVHIEAFPHGQVWSAQGRWLHQTSHRPQ
jgi:hypothetical protein